MSDSNETMAVSPRSPASSEDEPDQLEYLALKGARRDRYYAFMIKGQKAMEEGDYADAVIQFQQALNIIKLLIDDAWDDLFEAQQNSLRRLSVVGNCIRDLKQLLEDLDATSMNEKIKETKKIVKLLENFQPKLVSHVNTGYLSGSSSDSPPAPMKESEESAA